MFSACAFSAISVALFAVAVIDPGLLAGNASAVTIIGVGVTIAVGIGAFALGEFSVRVVALPGLITAGLASVLSLGDFEEYAPAMIIGLSFVVLNALVLIHALWVRRTLNATGRP
jgi:hypothetical protein